MCVTYYTSPHAITTITSSVPALSSIHSPSASICQSSPDLPSNPSSSGPSSSGPSSSGPSSSGPFSNTNSLELFQSQASLKQSSILYEMFPYGQISLLLELYNDVHETIQVFLDGLTTSAILKQFRASQMIHSTKHILIRLEHVIEDGISTLFKGDINIASNLEIELDGAVTADLGGVKRQFFTQFLRQMPRKLNLIEENAGIAFLTCNSDSLLGDHYSRLGKIIIYSILQEGPAFPFFSKAMYYYLVGGLEQALSYLSVDELPIATEYVVKKVLFAWGHLHLYTV